ncbi:MAG: exodeoxyribonuclease VII small subunit [Lachnospiraceae bacterium]|nr:exodeoxyribonuclease VII small subunit [Lachnospiraceae bacterium]MBQ2040981.1 exodeoxyribonuclease VII small subunit [Lachnospiraceae bacterium]
MAKTIKTAVAEEAEKSLSIEESFARLDEILEKMEDEETGLEDSFRLYEEGLRLIRHAESGIDKVEKKIRILNEGEES